jgi:hypothetical protein
MTTPLPAKLGITETSRNAAVGPAPSTVLDLLPDVSRRATGTGYDVILAFCPDRRALETNCARLPDRLAPAGALWLAWLKRASGIPTDIGEADVRRAGLATGLVDVKIAAIDADWSGLRFVRRRAER